jgi:glycosyltransferase involved in cell wall biosynthesis
MLSVYIDREAQLLSTVRIAEALTNTAPDWVRVIQEPDRADIQIIQATDLKARRRIRASRYAVVQHALTMEMVSRGNREKIVVPENFNAWDTVWSKALAVWTHHDIRTEMSWGGISSTYTAADLTPAARQLYWAPFGVDLGVFRRSVSARDIGIITTGIVSSPTEEAIEEAALAAQRSGLTTVHLGPSQVQGMTATIPGWSAVGPIADALLAALYGRAKWVSGLRHGEGFELPVVEGLACGARPICFDTPHQRFAFGELAVYVPESSGDVLVEHLARVMAEPPVPVSAEEYARIETDFSWEKLATGFWHAMAAACRDDNALAPRMTASPKPRNLRLASERKPRLLWIGDSPTTAWTGFGRASLNIIRELLPRFDVTVIGTTHDGCPYDRDAIPYDVYPPVGNAIEPRIAQLLQTIEPDVVVGQHDPWHVQNWARAVGKVPFVAIMPIDGKNVRCDYINDVALAIWWTRDAETEARRGGYTGRSAVVPLGVDLDTFYPRDKRQSRQTMMLPAQLHEAFIVGSIARNQPRKRLDLTAAHFAEWVKESKVEDAYLYVQTAPTSEAAVDVASIMQYYGLVHRLVLYQPALKRTLTEALMAAIYNSFDVYFSTTQGEGWGLPVMEAMACGVPVVAPDWSALGEWARSAALLVQCVDVAATYNHVSPMAGVKVGTLGGVPSKQGNIDALDLLYRRQTAYENAVKRGLELVHRPEYRWPDIGQQICRLVEGALQEKRGGVMQPVLEVAP